MFFRVHSSLPKISMEPAICCSKKNCWGTLAKPKDGESFQKMRQGGSTKRKKNQQQTFFFRSGKRTVAIENGPFSKMFPIKEGNSPLP